MSESHTISVFFDVRKGCTWCYLCSFSLFCPAVAGAVGQFDSRTTGSKKKKRRKAIFFSLFLYSTKGHLK